MLFRSKGWGYTADGPWRSDEVVKDLVPASLGPEFASATDTLARLDPRSVFMSGFLDRMTGGPRPAIRSR